jgi:CRISPR-associated endoribonuclease Cas6
MKREGDFFLIRNPIEFYASFLVDPMPNIVIEHLISDQNIRLGNEEYQIIDAKAYADPVDFRPGERLEMDIVTLSPIVAYKTVYVDEKKKTHYFKPYDPEFPKSIEENLKNKLSTIHDTESIALNFHIVPTNFDISKNESIVKYKGFIIKGYTGKFHISGSSELMHVAYHTGLGSKNAQGFGMFKIVS